MSGCKLAEEALPSYDDRWLRGPHAEETFRPQRSCPQTHYIGFVWLLCVCRMETKTGTLASIEIPPPHNWSQGEKFVTAICPQFLQFPTNSRNFLQLSPHFPRRFSSLIHPAAGRCRRDGLYLQLYSNQLVHLFIDAQGPSEQGEALSPLHLESQIVVGRHPQWVGILSSLLRHGAVWALEVFETRSAFSWVPPSSPIFDIGSLDPSPRLASHKPG